jgi:RNA polymerase sigma-70 factor (ECF subfamily)
MLLQDSRRAARTDPDGELILLEDQDRRLWNRDRIEEGLRVLDRAVALRRPGPYQLQAAIAAAHAEGRPWSEIVLLYDRLAFLEPSPVVELNRAVAVALSGRLEDGLELVDRLDELDGYHLLHAARGDLLRRLDRREDAAAAYRRALELTTNDAETRYLGRRLLEVS